MPHPDAPRTLAMLLALLALTACAPKPAAEPSAPPPVERPAGPAPEAAGAPHAAAPGAVIPADAPPEPRPGPREALQIATAGGAVALQVEVVDTEASRAKGLMFRRSIGPDEGMLFDFKSPRQVYFWMKNTYIPLDMVFIDATGRIVGVASDTVPLSLDPVGPGDVAVLGVLEIGAGRAAALGIHPGDMVSHRIFKPQ